MLEIILSLFPIIIILFMIFVLKKSSIYTGIVSCIITAIIAISPKFNTSIILLPEPIIKSSLTTSIIVYILFFGILLFHIMEKAGAIKGIASSIASSTDDRIYQVLILALGLSPLVEAVSGFGLAVVVIAPILLALGFNAVQSTLISLISLVIIPWGTLAMGTIIGATLGGVSLEAMGVGTSIMMIPLFVYFSILVSYIAVGKKELIKRIAEVVTIGLLLGISVWISNNFASVELAGLFGSLTVMLAVYSFVQIRKIRNRNQYKAITTKNIEEKNGKLIFIKHITPYLFLIISLFASRIISPVNEYLNRYLNISISKYNFELPLLYSPGFFLILSCLFAIFLFRLNKKEIVDSVNLTIKKCLPVIITTFLFVSVSEIMTEATMFQVLSNLAAESFGYFFVYISPFIGAIGGFLTGSNTASNSMFIRLQTQTAVQIGLSPVLLATTQNTSSSLMTMVNPSRVALGTSVCKIGDKENEIQKKMGLVGFGTLIIIIIELIIYTIINQM
ncbi:L-lactate permease [Chengkuizengella axinellae]|uniref:L-lactate permease n=1 Tax=Chengkuizengella axinellae TaxID=3064388 RepID=A0ABT9J460_9BACL|nr:L-lactate permease [Chengkuizengella sp. 2205SS18-9]MDP5276253.1 L-lactate permease [Chengkuizengella sp. 2205SS18-9]